MSKINICIQNLQNKQICGTSDKTVLRNIHDNAVDWLFMCGGKGRCTTCKIVVRQGLENLSDLTSSEEKYRIFRRLAADERLACQTFAHGDIVVEVAPENKLPHIVYS